MGAGHSHDHHHRGGSHGRAFAIGIGLNLVFVVVEVIYGFAAGSIALVADAGHNLSDVLGLLIAWGGAAMAASAPTPRFSYGLKKASILSALANALLLLVALGAIGAEAVRRLLHPEPTHGSTVVTVAAIGIVINGITAWLFARGRDGELNIRSAFQHMAADAVVSIGVVIAGIAIMATGLEWIDPAVSLAVGLIILWGTWGLLKEAVGMSLMGVPEHIALDEVERALARLDGVDAVHDLHVWPLSTTETALTVHLVTARADLPDGLIEDARLVLHERFRIEHTTIQVERHHPAHHSDC
jgi:cobalt-zinc-cadmium efflux system protein